MFIKSDLGGTCSRQLRFPWVSIQTCEDLGVFPGCHVKLKIESGRLLFTSPL